MLKIEKNKYYNRFDGQIAGLFDEKNNKFWDLQNEVLYNSEGLVFDYDKKEFIENGFFIDEAKGSASYVDENTLIVSKD